ncbi:hypothetical protein TNCV_88561 [Trichonephila clavipes]|nr:hypothetical protein TNCV_88561 [Trichonephila clavipes]
MHISCEFSAIQDWLETPVCSSKPKRARWGISGDCASQKKYKKSTKTCNAFVLQTKTSKVTRAFEHYLAEMQVQKSLKRRKHYSTKNLVYIQPCCKSFMNSIQRDSVIEENGAPYYNSVIGLCGRR